MLIMYLTEPEANEKWCPFARVVVAPRKSDALPDDVNADDGFIVGVSAGNRNMLTARGSRTNSAHARCYASACSCWRWAPGVTRAPNGKLIEREPSKTDARKLLPVEPRGYCGLAGKPSGAV